MAVVDQFESARPKAPAHPFQISLAELFLVFVISLAAGWFTRSPYFQLSFLVDEFNWLNTLALAEDGRLSWLSYFLPDDEHFVPAMRLNYLTQFRIFGTSWVDYRWMTAAALSLFATAMYWIIHYYFRDRVSAWTAALLLASASYGGWDSPFVWVIMQAFVFAFMFSAIAAALICMGADRDSWSYAIAASLAFFVAAMYYIFLLVLLPIYLFQLWIQSRRSARLPTRLVTLMIGSWLASLVTYVAAQSLRMEQLWVVNLQQPTYDVGGVLGRLIQFALISFQQLTIGYYWQPGSVILARPYLTFGLAAICIVSLIFIGRRRLLFLVVLAAPFLFLTSAIALARPHAEMFSVRYSIFLMIVWCVMFAMIAGSLCARVPNQYRWLAILSLLLGFVGFLFVQRAESRHYSRVIAKISEPQNARIEDMKFFFKEINQHSANQSLRLPDVPMKIPPPLGTGFLFPLSSAHSLWAKKLAPKLDIVGIDTLTPEEIARARSVLGKVTSPMAAETLQVLEEIQDDLSAMGQLDQLLSKANVSLTLGEQGIVCYLGGDIEFPTWQLRLLLDNLRVLKLSPKPDPDRISDLQAIQNREPTIWQQIQPILERFEVPTSG